MADRRRTFRALGVSGGFVVLLALGAVMDAACASFPAPKDYGGDHAKVDGLPVLAPCTLTHERHERPIALGLAGLPTGIWLQSIATIMVRHPKGLVLIDPGFGAAVQEDLAHAPLWFRTVMGDGVGSKPLGELLRANGVDPAEVRTALVTHSHWDHVGGLRDLPNVTTYVCAEERAFDEALGEDYVVHGTMPHQLAAKAGTFQTFTFDGPPYEGFERSHDFFGDGTLVAVPLFGHTPGSTGWFVSSGDGKRWLFVGDAAWTQDGIAKPAHKSRIASAIVDYDRDQLAATLGRLHDLYVNRKDLQLVVAHDVRTYVGVPECTKAPGAD